MKNAFYIILNMKSGSDYETFGKFMLGNDKRFAENLFNRLQGSRVVQNSNPIQLDFVEMKDGLPANLNVMCCNLQQLTDNCRLITKEIFKMLNMETL
ncbi:hypothetical protein [Foetidibacter luteolus]|uniref:hypothetical protein n=1 Tax=Foetidibacter luteolus TaxID=2608880 RepID=UPI00129AB90B|nr:hypothetical protein [Foetidibacter luteolus]